MHRRLHVIYEQAAVLLVLRGVPTQVTNVTSYTLRTNFVPCSRATYVHFVYKRKKPRQNMNPQFEVGH
jgi:hypothetical protein